MSVPPTRLLFATALTVVALLGSACSAGQPAATSTPSGTAGASATTGAAGTGTAEAPSGASGLSADQAAQAHQAALGLVALGGLGTEKGTTDALRAVLERTRGDLTSAVRQDQLIAALARFETQTGSPARPAMESPDATVD